jgi:hypothetical protein
VGKNKGIIEKHKLGIEIIVKERDYELTNEIKRLGYFKDRESSI